jgi:hypothetical protein
MWTWRIDLLFRIDNWRFAVIGLHEVRVSTCVINQLENSFSLTEAGLIYFILE